VTRDDSSTRILQRRRETNHSDQGFTLVELLIVVTIMPLIMGALALGLIAMFGLQHSVSNRIADTADAQVVSSTYLKDVQSALKVTTQNSSQPQQCGTGNQLLGLEWNGTDPTGYQTMVSYDSVAVTSSSATTYSLVRQFCTYGSTTPVSTQTIATDIAAPSAQVPPCFTIAACPSTTTTTNGWISTAGLPAVNLGITEPASKFSYALVATPRAWTSASGGGPSGGQYPATPLTLLGTGCSDLTLLQNATLSINVGGGSDNGAVAILSQCDGSAAISNGAVLGVQSVVTADPNLQTVAGKGIYPSTEYYESAFPDPYASLVAPTPAVTPASCTPNGNLYTCPPGYYATDPGFAIGATVIFTGGGTYTFNQNFVLPNGTNATFDTGTYIFNGSGNAISTGTNGISITGNNVLFYVPNGSVNFDNNSTISITAEPGYDGVSLWDAAAGATVQLANNSSAIDAYGGVYAPLGTVATSNNGTMAVAFIAASLAYFTQNTNINITTQ
jgi:prepilin-type N-terminal cleavage/methylation domain-containing protein